MYRMPDSGYHVVGFAPKALRQAVRILNARLEGGTHSTGTVSSTDASAMQMAAKRAEKSARQFDAFGRTKPPAMSPFDQSSAFPGHLARDARCIVNQDVVCHAFRHTRRVVAKMSTLQQGRGQHGRVSGGTTRHAQREQHEKHVNGGCLEL